MNTAFIPFFELDGENMFIDRGGLCTSQQRITIRNEIPIFTPDISYSTGNFSVLREKHSTLQLDSVNGTTDRFDTILHRTKWERDYFHGKSVLECGCGAGPDTEVLLSLGCKVLAVDLAGLDIAKNNIAENVNVQFVQASITNLPFKKKSFDIVFCHRVLQHTPNPEQVLSHILEFVKDNGVVFVHSYAHTFIQFFRWKYFMRPITKRMDPKHLYGLIKWYSKFFFHFTNFTAKFKNIGLYFNWVFIPFLNYRHVQKFKNKSDKYIIEYGIHDTFDALSPRFDNPIRASRMNKIASRILKRPFEIEKRRTVTLLRTKLQ